MTNCYGHHSYYNTKSHLNQYSLIFSINKNTALLVGSTVRYVTCVQLLFLPVFSYFKSVFSVVEYIGGYMATKAQ